VRWRRRLRLVKEPGYPADTSAMAPATYDLVCIGSGPAGEKAATQAAYFGKRTAIVEQRDKPGGAMVNSGTIPSKALRETALLCSALHRRPIPGVGAGLRLDQTLSIRRFMARRHLIEQQEHDRIEQSIDRHGIDVHHGRGRVAGPHTVEVQHDDGRVSRLETRYILIATGSSPLRPAHIPFDLPGVVDADGVLELERMPASLVIVGGGVIGCEYASIFAEMGVPVTLIHTGAHVLPFLDGEVRGHLVAAMREQGITFLADQSVTTVEPISGSVAGQGPAAIDPRGAPGAPAIRVRLNGGSALAAHVLLWAAGRSSNTKDLGLEDAGVALGERGLIPVSESYLTRVPSIYAAGDVIGFPALASTSMEQGRIAACHMFDIDFKHRLTSLMPIGLYTIPAVSMVGLSADEAVKQGRPVVLGRAHYRSNVRGRMLGDEQGLLKCVFDRSNRALLGAMIVGEDATELIHLAQTTMALGGGLDHFIDTCFNYPSLSELYKYAAYSALQAMADENRAAA
jgi:NAD(P) transhydrogenase